MLEGLTALKFFSAADDKRWAASRKAQKLNPASLAALYHSAFANWGLKLIL